MSKKKVSKIFYIVSDMVDSVGLDQTISYLSAYPDVYDKNTLLTNYILDLTCNEVGLSREQLLHKSGRNNIRVPALCVAVKLLRKYTKAENVDIGYTLNKGRPRISKYVSMFNNLSDKVKTDRDIIELHSILDEKTKNYKLTLK